MKRRELLRYLGVFSTAPIVARLAISKDDGLRLKLDSAMSRHKKSTKPDLLVMDAKRWQDINLTVAQYDGYALIKT